MPDFLSLMLLLLLLLFILTKAGEEEEEVSRMPFLATAGSLKVVKEEDRSRLLVPRLLDLAGPRSELEPFCEWDWESRFGFLSLSFRDAEGVQSIVDFSNRPTSESSEMLDRRIFFGAEASEADPVSALPFPFWLEVKESLSSLPSTLETEFVLPSGFLAGAGFPLFPKDVPVISISSSSSLSSTMTSEDFRLWVEELLDLFRFLREGLRSSSILLEED